MANYLSAVQKEKTAVLEWNDHGDLGRMEYFCRSGKGKQTKPAKIPFSVLDVDYYAGAGMQQLVGCLNDSYEKIIVDYGEITGTSLLECARCDKKIIIGALSEWQARAFLEILRADEKRDKSWCLAVAFGSEETRREAEKTFHQKLYRIPVSVDAFAVTRTDMDFFQSLLK